MCDACGAVHVCLLPAGVCAPLLRGIYGGGGVICVLDADVLYFDVHVHVLLHVHVNTMYRLFLAMHTCTST